MYRIPSYNLDCWVLKQAVTEATTTTPTCFCSLVSGGIQVILFIFLLNQPVIFIYSRESKNLTSRIRSPNCKIDPDSLAPCSGVTCSIFLCILCTSLVHELVLLQTVQLPPPAIGRMLQSQLLKPEGALVTHANSVESFFLEEMNPERKR